MPLSNDFTNTRLSYLKDSIKNTNTVAQQFYPRFVREYNEQFPYTEQKMSNIGNPISNTAIKGYLQEKTDQEVMDDLNTKIMSLTNDENVTKYIGTQLLKELSVPVLSYLNDNFDSIQKKILIPRDGISKDNFVNKVLGVLRTDTYKNDISVLDNTPVMPPPIIEDSDDENSLGQNIYSIRRQDKKSLIGRKTVLSNLFNTPQKSDDNTPQVVDATLVNKPGAKLGIPNEKNINVDLSSYDEYLSEYEKINIKLKKQGKDPDPYDVWVVNYRKAQDTKRAKAPIAPIARPRSKSFGIGIQLEPLKFQHRVIKHKQVFNNNKYAIDTKKLKKNILDLKYVKNANHVATFQPIEISNNLKNIIENIIKDHYNLQTEQFNDLTSTELRILKRLFKFLNIHDAPLETNSKENDSIQQKFEVAYASFLAGNDNKELIKELSQYVKLALHENTISKKDGYEILKKLNK